MRIFIFGERGTVVVLPYRGGYCWECETCGRNAGHNHGGNELLGPFESRDGAETSGRAHADKVCVGKADKKGKE